MKLVRYDRKLLSDEIGYKKTKYQRLLEEFDASDMEVAVVKDWTTKKTHMLVPEDSGQRLIDSDILERLSFLLRMETSF